MKEISPTKKKTTNKRFKDPEWYVSMAVDALDLNFGSVAKTLSQALSPQTEDTARELLAIYQQAFNAALNSLDIDQDIEPPGDAEDLFFEKVLDPDFPSHHPVYHRLINELKVAFSGDIDSDDNPEWSIRRSDLRKAFSAEFNAIVHTGSKRHAHAIEYIAALRKNSSSTESQTIAHMNSILEEVEYDPLAIDQELTLRKSYVTPSCTIQPVSVTGDSNKARKEKDNLIDALTTTINDRNAPIVIHGQPGHGKTSSVKMLVSVLCQLHQDRESPASVLLYEFKNLRSLNNPILQVLNSETDFIQDEKYFLGKQTVLILDGLDERQITDGSDDILRGFVTGLFRFSERINEQPGTKLNVVLTGRSQFVGQIKSCFNADHVVVEIKDFTDGQVSTWLSRFNAQKQNSNDVTAAQLEKYHLQELISQPILLSISSIMLSDSEGKRLLGELDSSTINRTQIYRTIIHWSYEKKWQKSPNATSLKDKLKFDDYFVLLQAIAFEMFKSGKESIKLSTLAANLSTSLFDLDFLENKEVSHIEQLCSQLRISFFFKGVEEKAFSFIHKSIKDFLVVSGMLDSFISLLEDCNPKKLDKEAQDLFSIFGVMRLSAEDHVPMLDEWIHHKKPNLSPHNKKLIAIWERVGQRDLPMVFNTPALAIDSQRNLLHNFYQILSRHCSTLSSSESTTLFGYEKPILIGYNEKTGSELIDFDEFMREIGESRNLCFSNQSLSNVGGVLQEFSGFVIQADFSNCEIHEIRLHHINFMNCSFNSAQLSDNWFADTEFVHCDFRNASIVLECRSGRHYGYEKHPFFNVKFITCKFINANIAIEEDQHFGFKESYHLFWNCHFESTTMEGESNCTIKYAKNFKGKRL